MCGENVFSAFLISRAAGSSPRVRGKLCAARGGRNAGGLIPACAGKTPPRLMVARRARAHPRVCGENGY